MLYQTKNPHGGDIYSEPITLDFSANTNPFGTPDGVLNAIRESLPQIHRYPDPYCRRLVRDIAEKESIAQEMILCGNGAAELIFSFCEGISAKRGLELAPTFSEYSRGIERLGGEMIRWPLRKETEFLPNEDILEAVHREKPDVVFLCNPNNPTGRMIPQELLMEILELTGNLGSRVFLDECFLDLTDRGISLVQKLERYPHLCILKAFTKSYGMAGVRLGYCMSSDQNLLRAMAQTVQPWNVSALAQAAGIAALQEKEFLEKTKDLIRIQRPQLKTYLETLGFYVCPSEGNYLLFQGPAGLAEELKRKQIAIRNCGNYHGLGEGWYRIAVRLPEENQILMCAISEAMERKTIWQRT